MSPIPSVTLPVSVDVKEFVDGALVDPPQAASASTDPTTTNTLTGSLIL